jgi:hypothetical protein
MATSPQPIFPQSWITAGLAVVNATSTTVTAVTASTSFGSQVKNLQATSNDTSAHDIAVFKNVGGTNYLIGTVAVPASAGFSSTVPAVNLLQALPGLPVDSNNNPYISLAATDLIEVGALVAITAAKTLTVVATSDIF